MPSPRNLLLPFQGDFGGEDAIPALPETRVAVCLQNKALLFSNEPPSLSFCPQIKTGMKDYMLAQSPAVPLPRCLCQILPSVSECPLWCHHVMETMIEPFNRTGMSLWSAPSLPLSRGRAEPSPESRSLWGGGTQSWATCPCPDWPGVALSTPVSFLLPLTSPVYFL